MALRIWMTAACVLSLGVTGYSTAAQVTDPGAALRQAAPKSLGKAERREVIANIAAAAEGRYVDPAGGARMAAHLRKRLASGAYDAFSDPVEFAAAVTADLRSAVPDVHLRAVYEPNRAPSTIVQRNAPAAAAGNAQGAGPRSFGRIDARSDLQIARTNFGFEAAQSLGGNVGYLKISRFVPLDLSSKAAIAAMDFLANSDALIVDLRGNIGGSPDTVQRILSYFTGPEPMQLLAHYSRDPEGTNRMMSLAEVPGQRLTGRPLYVLIDRHSASSAEAFAYIVQRRKLGVVIGETSSGAGNGGNMLPAGSGISFFIPFARVVDGPGWEQTGVKPDIEVDPSIAVPTAHHLALERLIKEAAEPVVKREREWALELARAGEGAANDGTSLADYAGQFGTRGFRVEDGKLMVVPATGRPVTLVRVAKDVFRFAGSRYTFERNSSGQVTAVKLETASGTQTRAERSPAA